MNSQISLVPLPKQNSAKYDSLLKLFNCEYFSVDMFMYYLVKKYNNRGVHKFLVNKLYSISNRNIHFYIPELW